jgi:glutamine cyclotransferase
MPAKATPAALKRRARAAKDAKADLGKLLTRSDSREVAGSLQDAMPRLLLRFCLTTLALAVAAALALALSPPELTDARASHHHSSYNQLRTVKYSQSLSQTVAERPTVQVLAKYPHDPAAFTQGLVVARQHGERDVFLIESTGLFGESSVRKVEIASGKVLAQYKLPSELFGEGVTLNDDGELVVLTWQSGKGFVLSLDKAAHNVGFAVKREFAFTSVTGEGWGIDSDGESLIVFWDPATLKERHRITVTLPSGEPVRLINELEFANGFIYANVWYQPVILKIDPKTGVAVSVFDCSQLIADAGADVNNGDVLNGIAYDGEEDVFYLTGKRWSALYKTRLVDNDARDHL